MKTETSKKQNSEKNVQTDVIDLDGDTCNSKFTSWVWEYFKRPTEKSFPNKIYCPYCKQAFTFNTKKNGTNAMGRHLKQTCKTSPCFVGLKGAISDGKRQKTLQFKNEPKDGNNGNNITSYAFNQERARKILARMCIKDNRPFNIVDDEGLRDMFWELNPDFKIPSRWTVARDCLQIYKEESLKLKSLLKGKRVSLTIDTWSSCQNINYMCLTAHWIDDDWILRKKILNFCTIANHNGKTIGKLVYDCLKEWDIDGVFTITVDNASSNDGAITFLKDELSGSNSILDCKYMHLRCCAHILNLVVRDGLEEQKEEIVKIRNSVRYVRSSPARLAKFESCVQKLGIECSKKVSLDVDTRWNSTYLMLETAIKYAKAFDRMRTSDTNYDDYFFGGDEENFEVNTRRKKKKKAKIVGAPTLNDFQNANYLVGFLQFFYEMTLKISGSKYSTSNLFFGELVSLHCKLGKMCMNNDDLKARDMATKMREKYEKYWENMDNLNFLLYVAVVLDPRRKMTYVNFCFKRMYGNDDGRVKEMRERVIQTLNELHDHYKNKEMKTNLGDGTGSSSSASNMEVDDLEEGFLKHLGEENEIGKTEVDIYLGDRVENERLMCDKFNLLIWWKNNSSKFSILSLVARHVLAMPISTVASESAFSTGGRLIDPLRSSLTPKTAEALICTQDWIRESPVDIESQFIQVQVLEELHDKLETIEFDELKRRPKSFENHFEED